MNSFIFSFMNRVLKWFLIVILFLISFLLVTFLFLPESMKEEYFKVFVNPRKLVIVFIGIFIGLSALILLRKENRD